MSVPPSSSSLRLAAEGALPVNGELELGELWSPPSSEADATTGGGRARELGRRLAERMLVRRSLDQDQDQDLGEPDWNREIARHGRRVVVALVARGVVLERAQELAQEAWMRLIEKHRRGELEELSLPGLVLRQAQYLAQDDYRKSQRREKLARAAGWSKHNPQFAEFEGSVGGPEACLGGEGNDLDQQIDARAQLEVVRQVLASKAPRAQQVFQRMHGQDQKKSAAEIADELGISVQRVRQIACELRAEIRRALTEAFDA